MSERRQNLPWKVFETIMEEALAPIAHRLSTIIQANRIVVLRNGRIVKDGSYEKLMAQRGFFHELAIRQLAPEE